MNADDTVVLVIGPVSAAGQAVLAERLGRPGVALAYAADALTAPDELVARASVAVVDGPELTEDFFHKAKRLSALGRVAGDPKSLPVESAAAARAGVAVCGGGRGRSSAATAEFSVLLMLAVVRELVPAVRTVRSGQWSVDPTAHAHLRPELGDLTIGLVGLGNVGTAVAGLLRPFGARVRYCSRSGRAPELERSLGVTRLPLSDLLADSDLISLHLRAPRGSWLADEAFFGAMRPGAIFVNAAKGHLVDEKALAAALRSGQLAAAAVDVTATEPLPADSPLLDVPNLVITPHIAGRTRSSALRYFTDVCDAISPYLRP